MDQLFMDLEKLTSISEQEDFLHIASENGDKIIRTGIFTNIIKQAIIGATPSYDARGSGHYDSCRHTGQYQRKGV